jgi:hypothetical protein
MDRAATLDEVVANYIAAVGCRDGAARRELIRRAVSDDFVLSSGSGVFHGCAEFSDELEQVHAKLPPGGSACEINANRGAPGATSIRVVLL